MKPTLDEFITRVRNNTPGNEWVTEPKVERLYVRYGRRYIATNGKAEPFTDVLDIANIEVEKEHQRTGVFTALVTRLRKTYPGMHIYVENASLEFRPLLRRLDFIEVPYDSFFLKGVDSWDPTSST